VPYKPHFSSFGVLVSLFLRSLGPLPLAVIGKARKGLGTRLEKPPCTRIFMCKNFVASNADIHRARHALLSRGGGMDYVTSPRNVCVGRILRLTRGSFCQLLQEVVGVLARRFWLRGAPVTARFCFSVFPFCFGFFFAHFLL